jgi:Ca2+-binding EF-hand superfamily protein
MKKKTPEVKEKRPVQEIRQEIRSYIRNERDTILKKWMALKESIRSEDHRREEFYHKKHIEDTKSLPVNVLKFIGTLKKSVRNTMRHKGGTPYSIIRSMFIYWDADKSGLINAEELLACMKSLGVKVTKQQCTEITQYYGKTTEEDAEMDYNELLQDVQRGEPSVIAFVSQSEDQERDDAEIRFEEVTDKFVNMPPIVKKFLEAVRNYLTVTMRNQGGTPFQHIRFLFQFYDYDYSNGLDHEELILACRRKMNLVINEEQAKQIVDYYDRKGQNQISYEKFLEDVCVDVKPILTFTELTPRRIDAAKKSLAVNPFIPKPFAAPPNKILEKFKQDVKLALVNKVNKLGGSFASWIREAFVVWDRQYTGKITQWEQLQGAAKRLGVTINEEEARALMSCYDRWGTGEMHYNFLTKEIMEEDPHFLANAKLCDPSVTATTRTPQHVQTCLGRINKAIDKFILKSKGKLDGRDVLHGTFLRFDADKSGHVNSEQFRRVLEEIRVVLDDVSLRETVKWFDTNGTQLLDYNALVNQLFGSDGVITEKLSLPRMREPSAYNTLMHSSAGAGRLPPMALSSTTSSLHATSSTSASHGDTVSSLLGSGPLSSSGNLMTISKSAQYITPTEFGVKASTMEKNLDPVESQAVKLARMKIKKTKILHERVKVEKKLAAIEEQRKKIIEDYKAKKMKQGAGHSIAANLEHH